MKQLLIGVTILLISFASEFPNEYPYRIGHIPEDDAIIVDSLFKVCNEDRIIDYYNVSQGGDQAAGYIGGVKAILKHIETDYPNLDLKNESGMLTIRFIINCNGQIGRFQIIENDLDFTPKKFDPLVVDQLFEITQNLDQWRPNHILGDHFDSTMYLTYRLKNGEIIDLLP